jgi:predicted nucleotidyltransferase component of viral defense system
MLHYETVFPDTLGLLKTLMNVPELEGFNLAGGTSLALQIGHRLSYDLDMFGNRPFEYQEIMDLLAPIATVKTMSQSRHILILDVAEIKVDFVNYRYPLINPPLLIDGLRLLSTADISAMKLAAIAGRGRKRDFTDLYFLLQEFSLREILDFYNQKYADGSEMMIVRSLTYFDDAETDEDLMLFKKVKWEKVKSTILKEVNTLFR